MTPKPTSPKVLPHHKLPAYLIWILLFFAFGAFCGSIIGYLTKDYIFSTLLSIYENTLSYLKKSDINRTTVFYIALQRNLKFILLLWFFSITNIWSYYSYGFSCYSGFIHGLFFLFCISLHGLQGVGDYLCYQIPQVLLLIPIYMATIYRCQLFHVSLSDRTKKRQLILHQLPFLFISLLLLVIACFLEGYVNVPLLALFLSD